RELEKYSAALRRSLGERRPRAPGVRRSISGAAEPAGRRRSGVGREGGPAAAESRGGGAPAAEPASGRSPRPDEPHFRGPPRPSVKRWSVSGRRPLRRSPASLPLLLSVSPLPLSGSSRSRALGGASAGNPCAAGQLGRALPALLAGEDPQGGVGAPHGPLGNALCCCYLPKQPLPLWRGSGDASTPRVIPSVASSPSLGAFPGSLSPNIP
ncbi:PREDICTED: translation initiation factor IF-2-like, partial [Chinchilla lanigera]|uniref:translation initiation factor IF-2-like n=1 Tax=Chinchilla lanigera TaxID=34839 RepID=UPI00069712D9